MLFVCFFLRTMYFDWKCAHVFYYLIKISCFLFLTLCLFDCAWSGMYHLKRPSWWFQGGGLFEGSSWWFLAAFWSLYVWYASDWWTPSKTCLVISSSLLTMMSLPTLVWSFVSGVSHVSSLSLCQTHAVTKPALDALSAHCHCVKPMLWLSLLWMPCQLIVIVSNPCCD